MQSKMLGPWWPMGLAVLATACSSSTTAETAKPQNLEVVSWFTSGSEESALTSLFAVVQNQNPNIVKITNAAQDQSTAAQQLIKDRMAQGNPPDSFQAISGADLETWINKGALEPLDSVSKSQGWANVIPAPVLKSVSGKNGSLYGVPIDIERDNTIFYNKKIFAAQNISAPTGVDNILAIAQKLKDGQAAWCNDKTNSASCSPFSVSDFSGWTMAAHVFESMLVAQAGPDFYEQYLSGTKSADSPEIRTTLASVAAMMDFANTDRASTKWTDAVARVCKGQSAMIILPDFIKGELANDGCKEDTIGYAPMQPAGTKAFVFVSVAFVLPIGAKDRDASLAFLQSAGSKAGQEAFNPLKGAIPVRTDTDNSKFDAISQQTLEDFNASDVKLVPGYAALTSGTFQDAVGKSLQAFADPASPSHKNVDSVVTTLVQNYSAITQR